MTTIQTKFSYKDESSAARRLTSLEDGPGGSMVVAKEHIIAVALDKVLPRPTIATREITHHYMETISIKHLIFADAVLGKHIMFHILPKRWSSLVKAVADSGVTFTEGDETEFARQWAPALSGSAARGRPDDYRGRPQPPPGQQRHVV